MRKKVKLLGILMAFVMVVTSVSVIATIGTTQANTGSPLRVELTSNREAYTLFGRMQFTATVTNVSDETVNNISAEAVLGDSLRPLAHRSEFTAERTSLAAGQSFSFTFNASIEELLSFDRLLLPLHWISSLFQGGTVNLDDNGFNDGRDYIEAQHDVELISFFSWLYDTKASVRVWYGSVSEGTTRPPTNEPEDSPDSLFLNPEEEGSAIGNGPINRVQWLTMLSEAADLQASDDVRYNLSSFIDVDINNPEFQALFSNYAGAVEISFRNNLIVVPEDSRFHPALSATEAFAVVTAIRAMGFYMDDTTLQDIFRIAQSINLFDGIPTSRNLTSDQANTMLAIVVDIVSPFNFSNDPISRIDFNENLIWLTGDIVLNYHFNNAIGTGSVQLASSTIGRFTIGDVIVLPSNVAQKITSITTQSDGSIMLSTVMPELEDLLAEDGRIYVRGSFEADFDNFILNPNLQEELGDDWIIINEQDENINSLFAPLSTNSELRVNRGIGSNGRYNLSVSFKEGCLTLSSVVYAPSVNANIDIRRGWFGIPIGINHFHVGINNRISASIESDITSVDRSFKLGTFPAIPLDPTDSLTATVIMHLAISARDSISITYTLESTVGFELVNGNTRFFQHATPSKTINLNTSARIGIRGQVMLNILSLDLADANAFLGLGAYGNLTPQINPPPEICLEVGAYIFLRLSALDNGLVSRLLNQRISVDIWNRNNSPWHQKWHFEDGQLVDRCTAGQSDNGTNPTQPDTTHIRTEQELRAISGGEQSSNRHYILGNDIHLTQEFTPIEDFRGIFDGQGHTIHNLFVLESSNRQQAGLFGSTHGATIKNITARIGEQGVTGRAAAGGLIGSTERSYPGTHVINAHVIGGKVSAIGYDGRVSSGGLIGLSGASIIESSSSIVNVFSLLSSTPTPTSPHLVRPVLAGGLIGSAYWGTRILNSYSTGDVFVNHEVTIFPVYAYAGGLIAWIEGNILNSYATGNIVVAEGFTGSRWINGLVGVSPRSIIEYSFVLSTQSIIVAGYSRENSNNVLTPNQMRNQASFAGWDFENVWEFRAGENNGFPVLRR